MNKKKKSHRWWFFFPRQVYANNFDFVREVDIDEAKEYVRA